MNPKPLSEMEQGSVFRMWFSFDKEPKKHRFFIVLNKTPKTDPLILLVSPTTNITGKEHHYRKHEKKPLVWVFPKEFPDFHYPSVIDCRATRPFLPEELCDYMQKNNLVLHSKIPDQKLNDIIEIFKNDDVIVPEKARIVLG